jgi:hypothetical protein
MSRVSGEGRGQTGFMVKKVERKFMASASYWKKAKKAASLFSIER